MGNEVGEDVAKGLMIYVVFDSMSASIYDQGLPQWGHVEWRPIWDIRVQQNAKSKNKRSKEK